MLILSRYCIKSRSNFVSKIFSRQCIGDSFWANFVEDFFLKTRRKPFSGDKWKFQVTSARIRIYNCQIRIISLKWNIHIVSYIDRHDVSLTMHLWDIFYIWHNLLIFRIVSQTECLLWYCSTEHWIPIETYFALSSRETFRAVKVCHSGIVYFIFQFWFGNSTRFQ